MIGLMWKTVLYGIFRRLANVINILKGTQSKQAMITLQEMAVFNSNTSQSYNKSNIYFIVSKFSKKP